MQHEWPKSGNLVKPNKNNYFCSLGDSNCFCQIGKKVISENLIKGYSLDMTVKDKTIKRPIIP